MINQDLFKTDAVRVAPADKPFWYTSGKLGPFYINTHFLVGSETLANEMLSLIEQAASEDRLSAPEKIFHGFIKIYQDSPVYKNVIDLIVEKAKNYDFDFISGGERRDFFFSMLPAHILGKPHITIYKDLTAVSTSSEFTSPKYCDKAHLNGRKVLHIADLITEASSYERAWIPVIRSFGAEISDTLAVVDRKQNGRAVLKSLNVGMDTLTAIDHELFDEALAIGAIDQAQYDLTMDFLKSPDDYMKSFIASHPDFIASQIALGGKAKERAELAISKGYV